MPHSKKIQMSLKCISKIVLCERSEHSSSHVPDASVQSNSDRPAHCFNMFVSFYSRFSMKENVKGKYMKTRSLHYLLSNSTGIWATIPRMAVPTSGSDLVDLGPFRT